jgi:CHAT domain-containing protein/tetratricopeptide (TPR) repeat protein
MIYLSMANSYGKRIKGIWHDNQKEAFSYALKAIEQLPKKAWPEKYAECYNILGTLTYNQAKTNEDIDKAIDYFDESLSVYDRVRYPMDWAKLQMNKGSALAKLTTDEAVIQKAIDAYFSTLQVYTNSAHPKRWASVHHNLGVLYLSIPTLSKENFAVAEEHFKLALGFRSESSSPDAIFDTYYSMGNLYFKYFQWEAAIEHYNNAIDIANELFFTAYTFEGQRDQVANLFGTYQNMAYCLIRLGKLKEAFEILEEGRTKLLAESISIQLIVQSIDESDRVRLKASTDLLKAIEAKAAKISNHIGKYKQIKEELRTARKQFSEVVSAIRGKYPDLRPANFSFVQLISIIPEGGALVIPFVTVKGGGAFVIPSGASEICLAHFVEMERLKTEAVIELFTSSNPQKKEMTWFKGYKDLSEGDILSWQRSLQYVTRELWTLLMEKISDRLQQSGIRQDSNIIIIPQGLLGILPLHCAWWQEHGNKIYFSDKYIVTYAPSARLLYLNKEMQTRPNSNTSISLLAVINPTLDLPFASTEGLEVLSMFHQTESLYLEGLSATLDKVISDSSRVSHLHFASHGVYNQQNPLQSGIVLSNNDILSVQKVITTMDLGNCELAVLSGCETGLFDIRHTPDEFIGLTFGFLKAGARNVLTSLWLVNDFSTMLLMRFFYTEYMINKKTPAVSITLAQRKLRDITNSELAEMLADKYDPCSDPFERPFSDPYHWGAFHLYGL